MLESTRPKQASKKNILPSAQVAEKHLRQDTLGNVALRHKKLKVSTTTAEEKLIEQRRWLVIFNAYMSGNAKEAGIVVDRYETDHGAKFVFPDMVFCVTCGDMFIMGDKCLNCATKKDKK
jgi:hypothetical protein